MGRIDTDLRGAPGSQKVDHPGRLAASHTKAVCSDPDATPEVVARALVNQLTLPSAPNYATTRAVVRLAEGVGAAEGHVRGVARRLTR